MFDFRIIDTPDGNQVIRRDLKTPYSALTPLQMVEYVEMDVQLTIMDIQKGKALRARAELERQRKFMNPLYRLACLCGLV
ncbi:hypothetical protein FMM75_22945 [Lachnospiraceae bacterium MD335]|nr:hypothetical protein [Lachnospiraceae bacterium MD335]